MVGEREKFLKVSEREEGKACRGKGREGGIDGWREGEREQVERATNAMPFR